MVLAALLCLFMEPDSKGELQLKSGFPQLQSAAAADSLAQSPKMTTPKRCASITVQEKMHPAIEMQGCRLNSPDKDDSNISQSRSLSMRDEPQKQQSDVGYRSEDRISKAIVRQKLAFIGSHYPVARPSRGNLKEVYNFIRTYTSEL